jgi:CRP-like cAMP-binding protein
VFLGEGTKYLVTHLPVGECIGELSIIDDRPVSATVTAGEPSRLLVIDQATLWRIMDAAPMRRCTGPSSWGGTGLFRRAARRNIPTRTRRASEEKPALARRVRVDSG